MIFKEETMTLNGHEVEFRSPREEDALMMIEGLKEVCGETDFLLSGPDEVKLTEEDEVKFIDMMNGIEKGGMLLAFVDGEYVGNSSYRVSDKRRFNHRGNIGIALKLKATGFGLGTEVLKRILESMKACGLEQAELDVFASNSRAIHVYKKLGFREIGRIPNASRLDSGEYVDELHMVLPLNDAEFWDLYDAERKPLGLKHKRGDKFGEGQFYVCCENWIVNSEGRFLVTKRHPDKKAGNQWEFGGGGTLAGETTRESCVREVFEETGIQITDDQVCLLATYANKNYFQDIFLIKKDVDLKDVKLQPGETVDVKWASDEEIQKMIENGEFVYSVGKRYALYKDKVGEVLKK